MIALVPRHGTKNPIFGVLAHGLYTLLEYTEHLFVKNLVCEAALCLIPDQSIFSEEKYEQ